LKRRIEEELHRFERFQLAECGGGWRRMLPFSRKSMSQRSMRSVVARMLSYANNLSTRRPGLRAGTHTPCRCR
jgi:hypothetical protein